MKSADGAVAEDALKRAEAYVEEEEGAANRLTGALGVFVTLIALAMTAFHLYAAYSIVPTQTLRTVHVTFVLVLSFLVFPIARRFRHRVMAWDWIAATAAIGIVAYMIAGGDDYTDRNTLPNPTDIAVGGLLIVLILEAARRSSGWIMPIICIAFLGYVLYGPLLPSPWTHKGYDVGRLVGHMVMTLEGVFGTAIDVSSQLVSMPSTKPMATGSNRFGPRWQRADISCDPHHRRQWPRLVVSWPS